MSELREQYTQITQGCRTLSKETRRLFFALDLSDTHNAKSRSAIVALKQTLAERGRPVPDENLHITLAFLGEVDSPAYRSLCEVADKISLPAISTQTTETGEFPKQGILWLGIEENATLSTLACQLHEAAAKILGRSAEHNFVPHITLARRARPTENRRSLRKPLTFYHFGIYASVPAENGHGVHYQCLNRWTLTR
ncbi:RNA 2',3'-cyclic phosphodiesterase [Grimontia marina]|uniref:RNA 2',3'-cyclic phosphodiesterase n=1 Tax=Grimontia marina TaxID=646534 RepID=UPI000787F9A9|nr:RNA 2',3'-cyclic phosphodiesterase [Grimontia marina]